MPTAVDLYDRAGMPRSISSLPAWRGLLWMVLALLLLDVACRRIAWDARRVRTFIGVALARVAPASVKGEATQATLASLRQVSGQVERRKEADAETVGPVTPDPVAPPAAG